MSHTVHLGYAAPMGQPLRQVFFDATDTLLRVKDSVGVIYARVASQHGLHASSAAVDASFRTEIRAVPQRPRPGATPDEIAALERDWWRQIARRTLAPFGAFERFDAFFDEVFELFRSPSVWEFLPGARETLHVLCSQERRLDIISDMDSRLFDVLTAFSLDDVFETVCLSFRTGYAKPDPRFFQAAARRLESEPRHCLHVGDGVVNDVEGALSAGMHAVLLDAGDAAALPAGAQRIRALDELPALLARLERD